MSPLLYFQPGAEAEIRHAVSQPAAPVAAAGCRTCKNASPNCISSDKNKLPITNNSYTKLMANHKERSIHDKKVLRIMTGIYCRRKHGGKGLCGGCSDFLDYAYRKIDNCPHGMKKTTCRLCVTHCYTPAKRETVREIMRISGQRMIFTHPVIAIRHLLREILKP